MSLFMIIASRFFVLGLLSTDIFDSLILFRDRRNRQRFLEAADDDERVTDRARLRMEFLLHFQTAHQLLISFGEHSIG